MPGFDSDPVFHPHRNTPGTKGSALTLVSANKDEVPAVFRQLAEAWEANGYDFHRRNYCTKCRRSVTKLPKIRRFVNIIQGEHENSQYYCSDLALGDLTHIPMSVWKESVELGVGLDAMIV